MIHLLLLLAENGEQQGRLPQAPQESAASLAELFSADDIVVRDRNIGAVIERGMNVVSALRTIEAGDFKPEVKAGARSARQEILRRHRVSSCKAPTDVRVSIPAGEYPLEEAAARALKPFGLTEFAVDRAIEGRRFQFALESSSVWTSIHEICRQGRLSWKTTHDQNHSRLVFHEIQAAAPEKMFALVGPYRLQGKIETEWQDSLLVLALGVPPGQAVHEASVSKLTFKDVDGRLVEVDKVEAFFDSTRMRRLYGHCTLALIRGNADVLKRIVRIEGDLLVKTPDELRLVDFDLPAIAKNTKIPIQIGDSKGDAEILESHSKDDVNLYFDMAALPKGQFLSWIEDEHHEFLLGVHAWQSDSSGNIIVGHPAKALPKWLVVARVERESGKSYAFDCRRQKP